MLLTLAIAFFSLIALMIVHEFGHFIIAKKFGAKVEEFGIGYPPRLFGKKFGDTLYSLNLIPLGAFVKIYGEEGDVDDYRSFANLGIWQRMLIVLGGVIAFWIAAILIFTVVFMIGAQIPIGDQDVVGVAGSEVRIVAVQVDSPAAAAGLKSGDVLVRLESMKYESAQSGPEILPITTIQEFQNFIKTHASEQLKLSFTRNGITQDALITPRVDYPEGQGPTGVALERFGTVIQKKPFYLAPFYGIWYTGKVTWQALQGIFGLLYSMVIGNGLPAGAALAGPVGITLFLSRAVEFGAGFFLYFIGSISVLLALFNLFPIPALDGGKILFLIIEKVKGRPVSPRLEQTLTVTFFLLLIVMSIFVTITFDVPRAIEFWKAGI